MPQAANSIVAQPPIGVVYRFAPDAHFPVAAPDCPSPPIKPVCTTDQISWPLEVSTRQRTAAAEIRLRGGNNTHQRTNVGTRKRVRRCAEYVTIAN